MKKFINNVLKISFVAILLFSMNVYASSLESINVSVEKENIKPGENVKIDINFGQSLKSYKFKIAFDKNIFEYVSVDGGEADVKESNVVVSFNESLAEVEARNNMSITFKAKSDIISSNPTEFLITATGLKNGEDSSDIDDITSAIVKNVIVEPEYKDYEIKLNASTDIIVNEAVEMALSYGSSLGRNYSNARLVARAITPEGGTVTLIGRDEEGAEHNIIQSGWGDPQGYGIGGKNCSQVLSVIGKFTKVGDYTIILSLINRKNSDSIIAQKEFTFSVKDMNGENKEQLGDGEQDLPKEQPNNNSEVTPEPNMPENKSEITNTNTQTKPTQLPKTGINIYIPCFIAIFSVIVLLVLNNKKNK